MLAATAVTVVTAGIRPAARAKREAHRVVAVIVGEDEDDVPRRRAGEPIEIETPLAGAGVQKRDTGRGGGGQDEHGATQSHGAEDSRGRHNACTPDLRRSVPLRRSEMP
jgi:hypothetical protein